TTAHTTYDTSPPQRSLKAHEARDTEPPADLARRYAGTLEEVPGDERPAGAQQARPDLRAAGQVHRLQQDPRAPRALRGRRLHLVRARGADQLDRALRPGEGRHA